MDFLRAPSVDGPGSADAISAAKRLFEGHLSQYAA